MKKHMLPTLVLAVSRKQISLYLYRYDSIEEIKDDHFPFVYTEEYEYAKPSRGTSFGGSLKGFEKDKSVMQKNRFEHFLREADKALSTYLADHSRPFLLAGTDEDRAHFHKITAHEARVTGEIKGSYAGKKKELLAHLA